MNIVNFILWILGVAAITAGWIFGQSMASFALLLWSFPAGYAAGTGFHELLTRLTERRSQWH